MAKKRRRRWPYVLLALLIIITIAAGILYRIFLTDEALRSRAQALLRERLQTDVEVEHGEFLGLGGVRFDGITVSASSEKLARPVVQVGTLTLRPDWSRLLTGSFAADEVTVSDVHVNAMLDEDGRWPFLRQIPPAREEPGAMPMITVKNASATVIAAEVVSYLPEISVSHFDMQIKPIGSDGQFSVTAGSPDSGFGALSIEAEVDPVAKRASGNLKITEFVIDERRRMLIPPSYRTEWDAFNPSGIVDATALFRWDDKDSQPLHVQGDVSVQQGTFRHPRLAQPVKDVVAKISFEDAKGTLESLKGRCWTASVAAKGDFLLPIGGNKAAYDIDISVANVPLDKTTRDSLPPEAKKVWDELNPSGRIAAQVHVSRVAGAEITYDASVALFDVKVNPTDFPAPASDISGTVAFDGEKLNFENIQGVINEGTFIVSGESWHKSDEFTASGSIKGFRIDDEISKALRNELENFITADYLKMWADEGALNGTADLSVAVTHKKDSPIHVEGAAQLKEMQFTHPLLENPIQFSGEVKYTPDSVSLSGVSGSWGKGEFALEDTDFKLNPLSGLALAWQIKNLEVVPNMRKLLPPVALREWDEFSPSGFASCSGIIEKKSAAERWHYYLLAECREASITYEPFPYPLRDVRGYMELRDGRTTDCWFECVNGDTQLQLQVQSYPYEGVRGVYVGLRARNALFDEDLRAGCPEVIQRVWDQIEPQGTFDLDLVVHWFKEPNAERGRNLYRARIALPEFSFKAEIPIVVHNGLVLLDAAESVGRNIRLKGRTVLEAVGVERIPLKALRAHYSYEDRLFQVNSLYGDCYGGTLSGEMKIAGGDEHPPAFKGTLFLEDADVAQMNASAESITGQLYAGAEFHGTTDDIDNFRAYGAMSIRNGEIGQLPGIFSPLNLLVLRKLNEPAFNSMEMSYTIIGDDLFAEEMNLLGSVLTLRGKGTVSGEGQLDFHFIPEFGPRLPLPRIPGISNIIDFIKGTIVPVTVQGAYDDPVLQMNPILSLTRTTQKLLFSIIPVNILREE